MHGLRISTILVIFLTGVFLTRSVAYEQGDPTGFVQVLPGDLKWTPNPAGGQVAVLLGDPRKPGPYVLRVKVAADYRIMPHKHPDTRTYTVISGTWQMGFGDQFDSAKLKTFPAGSVYILPADVSHFHLTGSEETIVQINSVGPSGIDFVNPADDPKKK